MEDVWVNKQKDIEYITLVLPRQVSKFHMLKLVFNILKTNLLFKMYLRHFKVLVLDTQTFQGSTDTRM